MRLSYRDLGEAIAAMTEEEKDMDVTMFDPDIEEYFMLTNIMRVPESDSDILPEGHPYLKKIEEGDCDE